MNAKQSLMTMLFVMETGTFYQKTLDKNRDMDVFISNLKKDQSMVESLANTARELDAFQDKQGEKTAFAVIDKIETHPQSKDESADTKLIFVINNFIAQYHACQSEIEQYAVGVVYNITIEHYLKQIPDETKIN